MKKVLSKSSFKKFLNYLEEENLEFVKTSTKHIKYAMMIKFLQSLGVVYNTKLEEDKIKANIIYNNEMLILEMDHNNETNFIAFFENLIFYTDKLITKKTNEINFL